MREAGGVIFPAMSDPGPRLVVRVITRLNVGGPTRHVAMLLRGLDPARYRQLLVYGVADPGEGDGVLPVPSDSVRIESLRRSLHLVRDYAAYRELRDLFRRLRPDLVHTHLGKAGAVGRFAARAAGVKAVVHTHHGLVFDGYFSRTGRVLYGMAERAAARRSDALIVQAPDQAREVLAALGDAAAGRVTIVPPGTDVPAFLRRGPPRPKPADGPRRLLVPARLVPVKDPFLALDVMRLLPERFTLTFAGDGPLADPVRNAVAADPRLAGRVSVVAPTADVRVLYEAADVVMLTSRSEGTPLALIEAQLAGVPVVATDVGATRSVVVLGGGSVVGRSAEELARAVVLEAERTPGAEVRSAVAAEFSAERLCRDVAALYERLFLYRRP